MSSTIYDFKDLRGALKWWLESYGFTVLMSERNDFQVAPDSSSYQACISSIHHADYFILLIGSRVGGLYNEADKISITRMEYREAASLAKAGKIKIVTFVRQDVWSVREDRKALENCIKEELKLELPEHQYDKIVNHSSKIVDDSKAIFSFLSEVGHTGEMKEAIRGDHGFPTNNWIYQFNYFEDIINTLKVQFNLHAKLNDLLLEQHLSKEIFNNLKLLHFRLQGTTRPITNLNSIRDNLPSRMDAKVRLNIDQINCFIEFLVDCLYPVQNLRMEHIGSAIDIGLYMKWNPDTSSFHETQIHKALCIIRETIANVPRLAQRVGGSNTPIQLENLIKASKGIQTVFDVEGYFLVAPINLSNNLINLDRLLSFVYCSINGKSPTFDFESLVTDRNPFKEHNTRIEEEQVNDEDFQDYLCGEKTSNGLKGT